MPYQSIDPATLASINDFSRPNRGVPIQLQHFSHMALKALTRER